MASKGDREDAGFKKVTPQHLQSLHERDQSKRLIIILEGASLETIKVKKSRKAYYYYLLIILTIAILFLKQFFYMGNLLSICDLIF